MASRMSIVTERRTTLHNIQQRAMRAVVRYMSEATAVKLALCMALRNSTPCAELVFNRCTAAAAAQYKDFLALTTEEFKVLFGAHVDLALATADPRNERTAAASSVAAQLQNRLKCTLLEKTQAAFWQQPARRAASVVALHMQQSEQVLPYATGAILRSDMRRVDDLRDSLDCDSSHVGSIVDAIDLLVGAAGIHA